MIVFIDIDSHSISVNLKNFTKSLLQLIKVNKMAEIVFQYNELKLPILHLTYGFVYSRLFLAMSDSYNSVSPYKTKQNIHAFSIWLNL